MNARHARQQSPGARRGFNLLEVTVASFLVSVLLVSTMKSVGAVTRSRQAAGETAQAAFLANTLATEIISRSYAEPTGTVPPAGSGGYVEWLQNGVTKTTSTTTLGPDSGESSAEHRQTFDDVDDYHGLNESPPRARDGSSLAATSGWRWTVAVVCVSADNLAQTGTNTGVKRATIAVSRNGKTLATRVLFVTDAWQQVGGN